MKVKQYILKEDLSITFTPEELWELILICEGAKVFNRDNMREVKKGCDLYDDYKRMAETAERMQNKLIELRDKNSVTEEVEI